MRTNVVKYHTLWPSCLALVIAACLGFGCSDDSTPSTDTGGTGQEAGAADGGVSDTSQAGTFEMVLNEDLLGVLELKFLKGRCVARMSVDAEDAAAKEALLAFGNVVADKIPLDGSKPTSEQELKEIIPASGEITGWDEDPADSIQGPWSGTDPWAWINGGAKPFEDNGFVAVAGETYLHSTDGWKLDLEVVDMGSTSGAEAAFREAEWDKGIKQ